MSADASTPFPREKEEEASYTAATDKKDEALVDGEKAEISGKSPVGTPDQTTKNNTSTVPSTFTGDVDAEKQQSPEQPEEFVRQIRGWKWVLVVLAILSSTFLFALDNTIVADIQAEIVIHFDAVDDLTWLSVAFLMGAAATNLIWGKVFGQFDAKWLYIANVVVFEVGSAMCGAAPNMGVMIAGRAIAGVGGAGMYVGVMTLLAACTSMHERPIYVGATGLTWGLGTVLGPIIGGGFAESSVGWRYAFYINLFLGAVCAPVYLFLLPSVDPVPGVPFVERLKRLDWVGSILIAGALVAGVFAIATGGISYDWDSGTIIGLFVTSGVLFFLFSIQQSFTVLTNTVDRVFPVEFMRSKTLLILFAMTAAGGTAIFVPIYMIPIFFIFTRGDGPLDAGVRLLPYICLMVFAVILNGILLSKYGLYMPWYTVGGVFVTIGGALMYTVDTGTSTASVYGYSIIIGVGVGCFAQASFSIAQAVVTRQGRPHFIPSAVGFITCAQVVGVTIALAIANSIFLNKSKDSIQDVLPDASSESIEQAIAGAASSFFVELSLDEARRVTEAIVNAQQDTYILVITAGALVIILSAFLKREKMFLEAGGAA